MQQLRQDLAAQFHERREVIEGTLYALLSRESILLLGPPGTGKSSLARAVAQAFGARYFERLLTKFTTPEEIFGPVSLKALENDRYTRITTDKRLQTGDRRSYISAAANALEEFNAQQAKLADLGNSAARRSRQAIADATSEILQLHTELARVVATGLRIGGAR